MTGDQGDMAEPAGGGRFGDRLARIGFVLAAAIEIDGDGHDCSRTEFFERGITLVAVLLSRFKMFDYFQ